LYSAGGATGEIYGLDPETGSIGKEIQKLDFREGEQQIDGGGVMDFGGLRHGAHSADLSPDGKILYVADL
jgi:carboxy-cis,cis-muconate cyclase